MDCKSKLLNYPRLRSVKDHGIAQEQSPDNAGLHSNHGDALKSNHEEYNNRKDNNH